MAETTTTSSIALAPKYSLHRNAAAADVGPFATKAHGVNADGYEWAHIQVVPGAGVDPTATVYWWSVEAAKFIQEHTPIAKAGVGASTPYEFTIEPRGRLFFVSLSGAGKVFVSGFDRKHPM